MNVAKYKTLSNARRVSPKSQGVGESVLKSVCRQLSKKVTPEHTTNSCKQSNRKQGSSWETSGENGKNQKTFGNLQKSKKSLAKKVNFKVRMVEPTKLDTSTKAWEACKRPQSHENNTANTNHLQCCFVGFMTTTAQNSSLSADVLVF